VTAVPADPDRACEHPVASAVVDVSRLVDTADGPATAFVADLRIACACCGEEFRFIGVRAGASGAEPRCSVDESELRIPIRPASSDPDFGLGIPGFAINYVGPRS
jgi:hypothetical protein